MLKKILLINYLLLTHYFPPVAIETMHPFMILLVNYFYTLFLFVCSIKCTASGRPPRPRCILCCRQIEKCAEKVNKYVIIVPMAAMELKGLIYCCAYQWHGMNLSLFMPTRYCRSDREWKTVGKVSCNLSPSFFDQFIVTQRFSGLSGC